MSLVNKGAARIVKDAQARETLMAEAIALVNDPQALEQISRNIAPLGVDDAADRIVKEVYNILSK